MDEHPNVQTVRKKPSILKANRDDVYVPAVLATISKEEDTKQIPMQILHAGIMYHDFRSYAGHQPKSYALIEISELIAEFDLPFTQCWYTPNSFHTLAASFIRERSGPLLRISGFSDEAYLRQIRRCFQYTLRGYHITFENIHSQLLHRIQTSFSLYITPKEQPDNPFPRSEIDQIRNLFEEVNLTRLIYVLPDFSLSHSYVFTQDSCSLLKQFGWIGMLDLILFYLSISSMNELSPRWIVYHIKSPLCDYFWKHKSLQTSKFSIQHLVLNQYSIRTGWQFVINPVPKKPEAVPFPFLFHQKKRRL